MSGFLVDALEPIFCRHSLKFDDPRQIYDVRMRPTLVDKGFTWFAIVTVGAITALLVFAVILLFMYPPG